MCAKDMLAHSGPGAMMAHCGWRDTKSSFHYVAADEISESIVAKVFTEASDDDA